MNKKQSLTIEVYNEDGEMHESIGGKMDFEDVRATMISILKNDGVPVIRQYGKHAAKETIMPAQEKPVQTWEMPLSLHIEYDGAKFSATGRYEDVMDAQAEFLKAIFEDD